MGSEIQNLLREDRMYVEPLEKLLNPLILQKTVQTILSTK